MKKKLQDPCILRDHVLLILDYHKIEGSMMIVNIKLKSSNSYEFNGVTEIEIKYPIVWFYWSQHETKGDYSWETSAIESFWVDDIEEFAVV